MKYALTLLFDRPQQFLEITESHFEAIRKARGGYLTLLDLEEKFDIAIEAFIDFERTHLDLALRHTVTWHLPHLALAADVRLINRKLLNLLAAGMLYTDQLKHAFCLLYGCRNSQQWLSIKAKIESLRASSLGYRTSEAVRDHIQHRGLPVNTLFVQLTAKDSDTERRIRVATDPQLAVEGLKEDRKMPKGLLDELKAKGESVPLTPLIKEYVECLGHLHEAVRQETSEMAVAYEGTLRDALQRTRDAYGTTRVAAAVKLGPQGTIDESHQLFEDLLQLRDALLKKNALLKNIAQRFVSTERQ